jgi:hypothetical protein
MYWGNVLSGESSWTKPDVVEKRKSFARESLSLAEMTKAKFTTAHQVKDYDLCCREMEFHGIYP